MNTLITGDFIADGNPKVIDLGTEVQWMRVINMTEAEATTQNHGFIYEWTAGMDDTSTCMYHPAADETVAITVYSGNFTPIDTSNYTIGAPIAITAGTNAVQPVYDTGDTDILITGGRAIVRVTGSEHLNLNGLDFTVDTVNDDTDFRLANILATAPGIAATTGHWRLVAPNLTVYDKVFPSRRFVADISQAAGAVVTTLVDHGYSIGQLVRMHVPSDSGMTQMNGLKGRVTAVTDGTFTLDINSTAFTAFNFPTAVPPVAPAVRKFTPASVVPVGDTYVIDAHGDKQPSYTGATRNVAFRGMVLRQGVLAPAGSNNDKIKWIASKSAIITG